MNRPCIAFLRAMSVISILAPAAARAGVLSVSDIFGQFNAIIFNNFTSSSDVEGRTVVGGNLTGGATFDINPAGAAASSFSALTVYGNATSGGTANVSNGGVTIAGNNNVSFNINGGSTAFIGGNNSGSITVGGSGSQSITVLGSNSGTLALSAGGSVYTGQSSGSTLSNSGNINANGASTIRINGDNSGNFTVNTGGTALVNGSNTGTISVNGGSLTYAGAAGNINNNGGTVTHGAVSITAPANTLPSFATQFQQPLQALSRQLNSVAANSTATSANNTITFNAHPDATGTSVFDVNSSLFAPNSTVTLNLNGATSVIINVMVDSCVQTNCAFTPQSSVNFNGFISYAGQVLWNFVNATNITFSSEFGGSVLAPGATVTNSSPIDGTLVASAFNGNGEVHSHPYTGAFPGGATAAPEPASLLLLSPALMGLMAARRRSTRPGPQNPLSPPAAPGSP